MKLFPSTPASASAELTEGTKETVNIARASRRRLVQGGVMAAGLATAIFIGGAAQAAGALLSQGKPTTSPNPSCNTTTETPAKATDGNGSGTKWCSAASGGKILTVTLGNGLAGTGYDLNQFKVYHAGSGNENLQYNTKKFHVEALQSGVWRVVTGTRYNTGDVKGNISVLAPDIHLESSAKNVTAVRLVVEQGAQDGQADVARIYEFQAFGNDSGPRSGY